MRMGMLLNFDIVLQLRVHCVGHGLCQFGSPKGFSNWFWEFSKPPLPSVGTCKRCTISLRVATCLNYSISFQSRFGLSYPKPFPLFATNPLTLPLPPLALWAIQQSIHSKSTTKSTTSDPIYSVRDLVKPTQWVSVNPQPNSVMNKTICENWTNPCPMKTNWQPDLKITCMKQV